MIGLGSIGRRHARNLAKILEKRKIEYQIDALRSNHAILRGDISGIINHEYYGFGEMPDDYDIIFVTNPTKLHFDTIKMAAPKTRHMFIEKPVFDLAGYDLSKLPLSGDGVYYVACPLRHKSILKYVKKIVPNEKVISVRIISTSYLPSWRKDVDYRQIYSAKSDMGGGATRDLIHEWDYASYLFGTPEKVYHMRSHVSNLEIDSDDLSVYIARYPGMILEMHLDYIGQKAERTLQLFTNEKRIDVDLMHNEIYEYANNQLMKKQKFPEEDFYINEMEYFLDCVEMGRCSENTILNAYDILKIALTEE